MKLLHYYLIVIILSIFPVISIFLTPNLPHTSDGAMHVVRIASYYKELSLGQFPVRWASDLNYGYGTPIFNFFHPLPYLIGSVFVALKFNLVTTLKILFAVSFIVSGIFMFLFSRAFFRDNQKAFLVTIMYQFAPFRLVEILVRGSLGGLYSYTILPLVLFGLTKLFQTGKYRYWCLTTVATCLLALSHNVIGFVFFGVSALFVLFFASDNRQKIIGLLSLFTGIALGAFFVLPAIIEHKYTYGYAFTKDLFYNHFPPFWNLFIPNLNNRESLRTAEVATQIGFFHVISIGMGFVALFRILRKNQYKKLIIYSLILFTVTLFFMQPISKPIWEKFSVLRQFQYPWRLLAIEVFATALASVLFLHYRFLRQTASYTVLVLMIVVSTVYYWHPPQGYQVISEADYWNYPLTTNYYGEVDTIWSEGPAKAYPKQRIEVIAGDALVSSVSRRSVMHQFIVDAKTDATILDRTQFFPGWRVFANGQSIPIEFQDQHYRGLITFVVHKGIYNVMVVFRQSKTQQLGNFISLGTAVLLIAGVFVARKKNII